jgi:hypothetical protein
MSKKKSKQPQFAWEIQTPILNNPLIWSQSVIAVGGGAAFVFLLLIGLNVYEKRWEQIPDSVIVGLSLFAGMFVLYVIAMLIMHGGGSTTRYEIDEKGIVQHSLYLKRKGFRWFRWLGLLGIFSGKSAGYTAAGATLLASSRQITGAKWQEIDWVEVYPSRGEIRLLNDWRTVVQVFCPAEQFDEVSQWIRQRIVPAKPQLRETPFAYKVFLSFFVLLFGFFLFPELPIRVKPVFTLVMMLSLLFALWSQGMKRTIASGIALLIAIGSPVLTWGLYGINLHKEGAGYALVLEGLLYVYMIYVAYDRLRRKQ